MNPRVIEALAMLIIAEWEQRETREAVASSIPEVYHDSQKVTEQS